jgi:hypothetical protein
MLFVASLMNVTPALEANFPSNLAWGTITTEVSSRCRRKENSNKLIFDILTAIKEDEKK